MQIFNANPVSPLRAWVHAILPLVYDDSLSYYEVLAKVADKMNEVVTHLNDVQEALHDNDEFLKNSIENLTQSFNNFQKSMLTRQENFETTWNERYENFEQSLTEKENQFESKITEQQTAFESKINSDFSTLSAQLDGDITNWEADVQEDLTTWQGEQEQKEQEFETNMEQKFADFLENYQKTFGVVQTIGVSETDVMSQNAVYNNAFLFRGNFSKTAYDLNDALYSGIYNFIECTLENAPDDYNSGILLCYQRNPVKPGQYRQVVQVAYKLYNTGAVEAYASRIVSTSDTTKWEYIDINQDIGTNTRATMSQNAINNYAFLFRGNYTNSTYDGDSFDLNNAQRSGIYNFINLPLTNAPDGFTSGVLLCYQRTEILSNGYAQQLVQEAYTVNSNGLFDRYATRIMLNSNSATPWVLTGIQQDIGTLDTATMSQKAIYNNAYLFRERISNQEYDLNNAKYTGIYSFTSATLTNAPDDFSDGMVVCYQRTPIKASEYWQVVQIAYKIGLNLEGTHFSEYASRVIASSGNNTAWKYINKLRGKTFAVIGDSWSAFPGWIPKNFKSWYPEQLSMEQTQMWWYLLSKNEGMNIYQINAYTGTSLCIDEKNPDYPGFIARVISDFSESITLKEKPDYYIILGGANDYSRSLDAGEVTYAYDNNTDKQSIPALSHMLSLLSLYNPNAKIFFFTQPTVTEAYTTGYEQVCEHFNVPYMQLPDVSVVGGHPNSNGQQEIYETIAKKLKAYL